MRRPGGRRLAGSVAFAAGLAVAAAGVAVGLSSARLPADAGTLPVTVPPSVTGPLSSPFAPTAPPSSAPPVPAVAWDLPTRVVIGARHVDAPVDAVGLAAGRALDVPDDPARLGWWIGSATPGSPRGTVLIAGHVDTAEDGPGALFGLETLPMGTRITVAAGPGVVTYTVVARRVYDKQRLPAALFATGTSPQLALVTCGGTFHDGRYSRNVVVYAEPTPSGRP